MPKPLHARQLPVWLLLVVTVAYVAACIGSNHDRSADPQPLPTTTTTTIKPDPHAEDEAAIRIVATQWLHVAVEAGDAPPGDLEVFSSYLTPRLAAYYRTKFEKQAADGLAGRPSATPANIYRVYDLAVNGEHAAFDECFVDDYVLIQKRTGAIVNDAVVTRHLRSTAIKSHGTWRLDSQHTVSESTGVSGCAA